MKRSLLVITSFFFYCIQTSAQTSVSGTLTQNTEWTLAGSPYTLTNTVGIPSGVALTIDAGVQVNGSYDLLVKGTVNIAGTAAQPVTFQNTRLLFKSTDLSLSTVQYIQFSQAGIQLADESEFNQDNPKNSNALIVSNCNFSSNGYARTKGYETSAKLHLENCNFSNATIYGYYPRSEKIEVNNATIVNSTVTSDSYNYGIIITNSTVNTTSFGLGCCGSNFDISNSQISGSDFHTFNSYGSVKISNATLTQTYINVPGANLTMTGTTMSATSIPQSFLIQADYCSITSSTLKGYSGIGIAKINSLYNSDTFNRVNFDSYSTGIEIDNFGTIKIDSCNFLNGTSYNIYNQSNKNVNAQNNYWGTANESTIQNKIYDLYDNINYGIVDYSNFSTSPLVTNPLPVPTGIFKGRQSTGNLIAWTKVNNPNVVGYKIYEKTSSSTFQFIADAGNTDSFITTENFQSDFVVTSYDAFADGVNDLLEGHESDYSGGAIEFFQLNSVNAIHVCQKSSVTTGFMKNYSFLGSSHFDLYISSNQNDFSHSVLAASVLSSDSAKIKWNIPDSVAAGHNLYFRLQSSQFNVFSSIVSFSVMPKPVVDFITSNLSCPLGSYQLSFSGVNNANLMLTWNLDGGTLLSNDSNIKLSVIWSSTGNKNVSLSGTQNGCSSSVTKVLSVAAPPTLSTPSINSIFVDEAAQKNIIRWTSDSILTKKINIYRQSTNNQYDLISAVDYSNKTYVDQTSLPNQQSDRYKISATDVCGKETGLSSEVHTILLQISQGGQGNWNLTWESREEKNAQILIYRKDNSNIWKNIGTVSSANSAFTDTNVSYGSNCYQVALTGASTQLKSNAACNGVTAIEGGIENFSVYPNPVNGLMNFYAEGQGLYELVDLMNRPLISGQAETGNNEIRVQSIPAGFYLLKVTIGSTTKSVKIVKN